MDGSPIDDQELERLRAKVRTALEAPIPVHSISAPTIRFAPMVADFLDAVVEFKYDGTIRCAHIRVSSLELVGSQVGKELVGLLIERTAAAILAEISRK